MEPRKNKYGWMPLIMALCIIGGIFIGLYFSRFGESSFPRFIKSSSKIDNVLEIINSDYVDTIQMADLIEKAIPAIFKELDPHSVYIPAADLQSVNEELEGSFSGIGIQFNLTDDTVRVVGIISGGPSEKAGLLPGDRILTIDDSLFVGVTTEKVMKALRGDKGSKVKVGIRRFGAEKLLEYEITRGDIPVNSIDAAFSVKGIGYIKVSKFGRTTYSEFITALAKLQNQNNKGFIVDLRGNSGGYMDAAINMVNEFLPKGSLIVYTKGKNYPRNDYFANGTGTAQNTPIVVLIDEWSASASEIFAGAIQDNDRGAIVGRRSFGKGLVQTQIPLRDESAIRLTIARYYTPSGRSIQKKYEMGKGDDYEMDIINRYEHGEFDSQDSIKLDDSETFKTIDGRTVYGGGGIMPDYFVPRDTMGVNSYYTNLRNNGVIYEYAFQYADNNRNTLKAYKSAEELEAYLNTLPLVDDIADFAVKKGIRKRPMLISESHQILRLQINAFIIRNILDEDAFYKVYYKDDPTLNKAIELIGKETSRPLVVAGND